MATKTQTRRPEEPIEAPGGELVRVTRDAVAELDAFDAKLADLRRRYDGVVYDMDDPKHEKQARSDRRAVGTTIADLDRRHRAVKAPLLDATRTLDSRRRSIKDALTDLRDRISRQIEAHEQKEVDRVRSHRERIDRIRAAATCPSDTPADSLRAMLEGTREIVVDDSFEEFEKEARDARDETVEALGRRLDERRRYESEQAELARLRAEKQGRDRVEMERRAAERARAEAEADAVRERERLEKEKRDAEERHRRELAEAEERASRAADEERRRIEREEERKRREAEARRAREEHRRNVHGEAAADLVEHLGVGRDEASRVVELVASGRVRHLKVDY